MSQGVRIKDTAKRQEPAFRSQTQESGVRNKETGAKASIKL